MKIIKLDTPIMLCLLAVVAFYFDPISAAHIHFSDDKSGAIAGRFVSIPARDYINAFRAPLKLGQCPLVMKDGTIQTCKDEFEGTSMYISTGATTVDVSTVQTAEDILLHTMGGLGASIGVLGLASVNAKIKVAVNTDTDKNSLNLVSSYAINKGMITLHKPKPKFVEGEKALFLSEIELGGNEMLLVTLQFESEAKKIQAEASITLKILFISITAKLQHIEETFQSKASCRIQFKSSWRKDLDEYFSELRNCIPRVKQVEDMYMKGPQELRDMDTDDEKSHYFYHFSSWKANPYGGQVNMALVNHDLQFLTEQNTEVKAVIEKINKLKDQRFPTEVKKEMLQLNTTLTDITQKITDGLKEYHKLQPEERENLRDVYGRKKAPMYYDRYLQRILTKGQEEF